MNALHRAPLNRYTPPPPRLRPLTMRKWEIVAHLYHDGLTYDQIGDRLGISARTVMKHIEQIASPIPGEQPPAWKVLRFAAQYLELGYGPGVVK